MSGEVAAQHWAQMPVDTAVADALGLSFIAVDEEWHHVVFDVRATPRDTVAVIRYSQLARKDMPTHVRVPTHRRLDDIMAEYRGIQTSRLVLVPAVRWPTHLSDPRWVILWTMLATTALGLPYSLTHDGATILLPWLIGMAAGVFLITVWHEPIAVRAAMGARGWFAMRMSSCTCAALPPPAPSPAWPSARSRSLLAMRSRKAASRS